MNNQIKKTIKSLLDVSEKMIIRELPLISQAIRKINSWIWGVEFSVIKKKDKQTRDKYDSEKLNELINELDSIKKDSPDEVSSI